MTASMSLQCQMHSDLPCLFRLTTVLLSALGLSRRNLLDPRLGLPAQATSEVRLSAAARHVDGIIGAMGGTYRIRTPWGVLKESPRPVDPADLERCLRNRATINKGAIVGSMARGRYRKDFAEKLAASPTQMAIKARESVLRTQAQAQAGVRTPLPAARLEMSSLVCILLDLLATGNAASGGKLPMSSVPLVTGVPLPVLRGMTGPRPQKVGKRGARSASGVAVGGRAPGVIRGELHPIDSLAYIINQAGCSIDILVGKRQYTLPAAIDASFRRALMEALRESPRVASTPCVQPAQIGNPRHRQVIQMVLAGERRIPEKVGFSYEWIRRICQTYGYDRRSRKEGAGPPGLGSPMATDMARSIMRGWGRRKASR